MNQGNGVIQVGVIVYPLNQQKAIQYVWYKFVI